MNDSNPLAKGCGLVILVGLFLLLVAVCTGIGSNWQTSDGYRDGSVQKFSHKGLLVKTWEGELSLDGFRGRSKGPKAGQGSGSVWSFTVHDQDLVAKINALKPDQRVRLHYREFMTRYPWQGDTTYVVSAVDLID